MQFAEKHTKNIICGLSRVPTSDATTTIPLNIHDI
jgi:hypothetical protein